MVHTREIPRLETGLARLDKLLGGGLPLGSMTAIAGRPGAGKTVLAQQVCFHHASPDAPALYFSTLSEPTAKVLRYLSCFAFFDASKLDASVQFIDLGGIARTGDLEQVAAHILEHVKRVEPAIVVVDSFKVLDELARSRDDLRRFGYELAVRLMVWECTSLLLGGYGRGELTTNPLFSVVDGLVLLGQRRAARKRQRFLEVVKLRGGRHSREAHPYVITKDGLRVLPRR